MKNVLLIAAILALLNVHAQKKGSFTDKRDNKVYKTIIYDGLEWMAENLAYLPQVGPLGSDCGYFVAGYSGTNIQEAKKSKQYKEYGVMYQYKVLQDVCPVGWRMPTSEEVYKYMSNFGKWKDAYLYKNENFGKEGFVFPYSGTYLKISKNLYREGDCAAFWAKDGKYLFIEKNNVGVLTMSYAENGLSVRCVKGYDNVAPDGLWLMPESDEEWAERKKKIEAKLEKEKNKTTTASNKTNNVNQKTSINTKSNVDYKNIKLKYLGTVGDQKFRAYFPCKPSYELLNQNYQKKEIEDRSSCKYGDLIFRMHSFKKKYPVGKKPDVYQTIENYLKEFKRKYGSSSYLHFQRKYWEGYSLKYGKLNGNRIEHYGLLVDYPEKNYYYVIFMEIEATNKAGIPIDLMKKFYDSFNTTD